METIGPNAHVVLDYTLRDDEGLVLDGSDTDGGEPIAYVHGYGMVVPGLEVAIVGMRAGQEKEVVVEPAGGFGERDEELVLEVDRSEFPQPEAVSAGDELVAESPDGDEVPMHVVEVKEDTVIVDANHPLAGKTLRYQVKVREVRAATEQEIAQAAAAFEEAGYVDSNEQRSDLIPLGGLVSSRTAREPGDAPKDEPKDETANETGKKPLKK
jgi:FKBP-type peptidyl-prolyl cis-trans isomerase SlyD